MKQTCLITAVLCALVLFLCSPAVAAPFSGLPITRIELRDDRGAILPPSGQLASLILIKSGDTLSAEKIREGIAYLYLTGKFRDVRVDGFPDEGGVKLVYTLVPITVVERIVVTGNHALSRDTILQELRGIEGRELREEKFPDYRTSIQTLYQPEGYYGTAVRFTVEQLKDPHKVELHVTIQEPERTVIEDINFSGNSVFTKEQLLKVMSSAPGKPLRTNVLLDEDMAAILDKYTRAGYPAAEPGPVDITFVEGKAWVLVLGNEGPRVSASFSGNEEFSDGELREQLLIWSEHDISDSIIDSSMDNIRNLYREEGYDEVRVTVRKTESPGSLQFHFEVQEGRRITVDKIIITGNSYFPTKQIKGELSLQESGFFTSKPFQRALVDKGVDYLRERYQDEGFLSAEIREEVELVDNGESAVITIDISEGPQTRVGTVTVEGNRDLPETDIRTRLTLQPGAPYRERLVDEDRYRILSVYSEKGYLYARVETEKKPADGTMDITYIITEDSPVTIGKIILRGNQRTREDVVMRELLLKTGDHYDYEKILQSQQRIYRFGYFNQARFEPVHPGEKEYVKDMLFTMEEGAAGSFGVGVGYGDLDRLRAFMELSYRNLWGRAHYAGLRVERSDILERAIMNYQHPWIFGYDAQGKFTLNWSDQKHINSDTREVYYQTRTMSSSYGIEKKLDRLTASLTYAFENVENYNVQPGAILSQDDIGRVRISSLSPALVWDLRDDIFNPRTGSLYGLVVKEAMHHLGSQADFTKISARTSWYFSAGRRLVTALSARGGMAWSHYTTTEVPIHERFYLGGNTTVRGYTQDAVGPTKDNIPTGGSSMWLVNAETRVMAGENLGFVLFYDVGRVWISRTEQDPDPVNQPDQFRPPARSSYGAGIRYGTPVGPLRIDYGQKIHRLPGESPGELHFNIGHTF